MHFLEIRKMKACLQTRNRVKQEVCPGQLPMSDGMGTFPHRDKITAAKLPDKKIYSTDKIANRMASGHWPALR